MTLESSIDAKDAAAAPPDIAVGPSLLGSLILAARHHALHLNEQQMERDFGVKGAEVTWERLVDLAAEIGLKAEATRLGWRHFAKLDKLVPAIVRLRSGLAMVLSRVEISDRGAVEIILQDPLADSDAMLPLDEERFAAACDGDIILLKREYPLVTDEQPFTIRAVLGRVLRSPSIVRDMIIASVLLGLLAAAPILFWRILIDRVLIYQALNTLTVLCLMMFILVAFETAFAYLRRHLAQNIIRRVDVSLWTSLFSDLLNLPISFFERSQTGVITRDMFELTKIRDFLAEHLFGAVLDALVLFIFVPILFYFSPRLTFIVLALSVLACLWIVLMLPVLHTKNIRVFAAEGRKGAFLVETLHGIRTVKSLALESRRRREWDMLVARAAHFRYDESSTVNLINTVMLPIERAMTTGVIAIAVYFAITESAAVYVGALVAFMMLSMRVAAPLMELSTIIQRYDEARTAVSTIAAMVNRPKEEGRHDLALRTPIEGQIEFDDVTFTYPGSLIPALEKVTFSIPKGTIFGIVGRSGSGKTTVTRLLQRLHSDYRGSIRIDDANLAQYDVDHVRANVGVVLQENFLFSGPVSSCISAARPSASFEEIVRAARLAGAEEFIERLPDGYATHIFEGSPNLSGGQRQRIAIARALINDPKVLILDEATSALDAESEAIVNANLQSIAAGRTMIIISHRLSALVQADAIMVLERGAVYDIGKHEELLERCDIYRMLWDQQHRHLNLGK